MKNYLIIVNNVTLYKIHDDEKLAMKMFEYYTNKYNDDFTLIEIDKYL